MAATLPPINGSKSGYLQKTPEYASGSARNGRQLLKPLKKPKNNREQDYLLKQEHLRAQQPGLTKNETTAYRNSFKHNLCLDMLQDGFHKSFGELFALIKQQQEDRLRAGPESVMWNQIMLENEHDKLDMLKIHLTGAEAAERHDDYAEVYQERFELAKFFQSTGDQWLSDYFFETCLSTSSKIDNDEGKMQAEGFCNVGLSMEDSRRFIDAAEHFEEYYKLSKDHDDWTTVDNVSFYTDACVNLYRIYLTIGNEEASDDSEKSLDYLQKALLMARESGDNMLMGEASYKLGLAYERSGDGETALLHLNNFLKTCQNSGDNDGIGRACDAISKAYLRQGKVDESIEYLKQFEIVAEKSGQEKSFSQACHNLGNIFNSRGRYEEAAECFGKAYKISRGMSDGDAINTNRVQYGIAMAHKMLGPYSSHLTIPGIPSLERVIDWKSSRTDEFEKALPDPSTVELEAPAEPTTTPSQPSQAEKQDDKAEQKEEVEEDKQIDDQSQKEDNTTNNESTSDTQAPTAND